MKEPQWVTTPQIPEEHVALKEKRFMSKRFQGVKYVKADIRLKKAPKYFDFIYDPDLDRLHIGFSEESFMVREEDDFCDWIFIERGMESGDIVGIEVVGAKTHKLTLEMIQTLFQDIEGSEEQKEYVRGQIQNIKRMLRAA